MTLDVEIQDGDESRIRPLPNPNFADLLTIPVGSEVVVINYEGEPPSIGLVGWNDEAIRSGAENLDPSDPDDRYTGTFMAFLPPESHSKNVVDEEQIVEQALGSLETVKDLAGMTLLIRTVIQEARKGLVENPF